MIQVSINLDNQIKKYSENMFLLLYTHQRDKFPLMLLAKIKSILVYNLYKWLTISTGTNTFDMSMKVYAL